VLFDCTVVASMSVSALSRTYFWNLLSSYWLTGTILPVPNDHSFV